MMTVLPHPDDSTSMATLHSIANISQVSCSDIIHPSTFIDVSIWVHTLSLSMPAALAPLACVLLPVAVHTLAGAAFQISEPLAIIHIPGVRKLALALTATLIAMPLASVVVTIREFLRAHSLLLVGLPLAAPC